MIDGSEKRNCQLAFELHNSHVCEKRSNVDVKIGSKATAKRLENVLQNIILFNQSPYVKGRTNFDAVRTIEDIMEFSKRYSIDGRMI